MGVYPVAEESFLSLFGGENIFGTRPAPTSFCVVGIPFGARDVPSGFGI